MDPTLHSRRILLTGGRGSLAGVLGGHLEAGGAAVTRLSRTAGPGYRSLEELFTTDLLPTADTVLHLAWSTVPFSAEQKPGIEQEQDLPLLARLLDRIAALPTARRPHLVFFSSGGTVYGNARDNRPHAESDPCAPIGRHGQAKLAAERLLADHSATAQLPWTILRVSNPYGFPVPDGRPQGIIPAAIRAGREGRPMTIWGDGSARKDFLHHSDFSRAVAEVIARRPAGIYNVCSGRSHTIKEVLELVSTASGRPSAITQAPAPYAWDVHDSLLDNRKLRAATGWQALMPLAEGIRQMVGEQGLR